MVSGRVMVTEPFPVGSTSTFQPWLLPWVIRLALAILPPVTVRAWSLNPGVAGVHVLAEGQVRR